MRLTPVVAAIPVAASAFQLPFKLSTLFSTAQAEQVPLYSQTRPAEPVKPRIAIIGAGAGGSSAAFWISKAKERSDLDLDSVDVYEKEDWIGGRSTVVYPYGNNSYPAVELGASIFISANKNLWRSTDEFNLTRRDFRDESDGMGIWDGNEMLFTANGGWWSIWDNIKALWRYGFYSPRRAQAVVQEMVAKFLTLYGSETPKWTNITELSAALEWEELVASTTADFFKAQGVSEQFIGELVEASTRVNYGQNVDQIHALEGTVSLAPAGASAVDGGNFQIFEQFLNRSGANVYLNTPVQSITPDGAGNWVIASSRGSETYTGVILAAPWHSTNIQLPSAIAESIPKQPYVHLHVTHLSTTRATVSPEALGLPPSTKMPAMLLTVRKGNAEPEFNSLSYHGKISEDEWVVKIFSKGRIEDERLSQLFEGQVGWIHRKEWDAYPVLPPTTTFPDVKLSPGLYYVNSFEPFISTMETETLSSRNIVDLLLQEHFGASICGRKEDDGTDTTKKDADEYIYGWDC
ncbi:Prenylcysteine lyase [Mycena kentingensis (nom. inval.)]|nr:Prenylcysteine lyase [Mycena kentingensis (nom. inval.)]